MLPFSCVLRISGPVAFAALACTGRSIAVYSKSAAPDPVASVDGGSVDGGSLDGSAEGGEHPSPSSTDGSGEQEGGPSVVNDSTTADAVDVSVPVVAKRLVLDRGEQLRFETMSQHGDWLAYTEYQGERATLDEYCDLPDGECYTAVNLMAVPTTGGTPKTIATDLGLAFARFVGTTLFIVRGGTRVPEVLNDLLNRSPELLAWRPGDAEPKSLGVDVDPGAFRSSRDGRWVSVEVNDLRRDNVRTAEVLLIDTQTLSVRSVANRDHVRARFSRDSRWLFLGGLHQGNDTLVSTVDRLSLSDGSVETVGPLADLQWKLSHDGNWVIQRDRGLSRTPAAGGEPQLIVSATIPLGGEQFDIGRDGVNLSFRGEGPNGFGLFSVPLAGGSPVTLIERDVEGILAHYASTIVCMTRPDEGLLHLNAISSAGGDARELGLYSGGDAELYVLDQHDDVLLVRDATGTIRWLRSVNAAPEVITKSGRGAKLLADGRALMLSDSVAAMEPAPDAWGVPDGRAFTIVGEGTLWVSDAGNLTLLEPHVTGPFGLDPNRGAWYVTTVQVEDETNLVVDLVP